MHCSGRVTIRIGTGIRSSPEQYTAAAIARPGLEYCQGMSGPILCDQNPIFCQAWQGMSGLPGEGGGEAEKEGGGASRGWRRAETFPVAGAGQFSGR